MLPKFRLYGFQNLVTHLKIHLLNLSCDFSNFAFSFLDSKYCWFNSRLFNLTTERNITSEASKINTVQLDICFFSIENIVEPTHVFFTFQKSQKNQV